MRSISTTLITLTVAALVATTVPDAEAPTKLPESTRDLEGAVGARCDTATAADEALTRLGGRHVAVFIRPQADLDALCASGIRWLRRADARRLRPPGSRLRRPDLPYQRLAEFLSQPQQ